MKSTVYTRTGKDNGEVTLPESIFGLPWNADLVTQVVNSLNSSKRKNIAHTKNRGEVRGGGKKPWQQKGTGRARHGSTRSPIWVGGGVTHGPRNEKNYLRKVSKKMKAKALYTILSQKFRDKEVLFVDSLALSTPKTKEALLTLVSFSKVKGFENLKSKRRNAALLLTAKKETDVERSFRNMGNVEVLEARNLHPLALLQYKYVVVENPEEAVKVFPKVATSKRKVVKK